MPYSTIFVAMHRNRLQKLLEFIELEPHDPFLHYALATEYLKLNDSEKALEYFEYLVKEHAGYVGTYYHLGKLYEALGRKEDAITIYQSGMQVARTARDQHALSELQAAHAGAAGLDDEDD
jgi:tetratricopeptide (TPR) repeat protein